MTDLAKITDLFSNCHLVEVQRIIERYGKEAVELREDQEYDPEVTWIDLYVNEKFMTSYRSVPKKENCRAFGGKCDCRQTTTTVTYPDMEGMATELQDYMFGYVG